MSSRDHFDPLESFSYKVFQIKFIILEVVMLLGFLAWLWDKFRHDVLPAPPPIEHHYSPPIVQPQNKKPAVTDGVFVLILSEPS